MCHYYLLGIEPTRSVKKTWNKNSDSFEWVWSLLVGFFIGKPELYFSATSVLILLALLCSMLAVAPHPEGGSVWETLAVLVVLGDFDNSVRTG